MIVGNQSDRETEREISKIDGEAITKKLGCDFVETSAQDGRNVATAFYDIIRLQQPLGSWSGNLPPVETRVKEKVWTTVCNHIAKIISRAYCAVELIETRNH